MFTELINLAANIPLLLTSCSIKNNCQLSSVKCGTKYQSSRKRCTCVPQDSRLPGHVLDKNTGNLYTLFSFPFQQKIRPHGHLNGNASVNSPCAQPPTPPCYCGPFARLVSPWGGAFANFALPGGRAFANPPAIPELLTSTRFPIRI